MGIRSPKIDGNRVPNDITQRCYSSSELTAAQCLFLALRDIGNIDGRADLQWTVVSLKGSDGDSRVAAARDVPDAEPPPADASGAKAALDRVAIPADVADHIAGIISPGPSVIVSDEALSAETGEGTEFVVVMNDEPRGGIKNRTPRRER
jgi:hypothetical protein